MSTTVPLAGRAAVRDAAVRAFHTLWQSFGASLTVAYAASGLHVSQITDVSSAKRFAVAAAAAVVAALLSTVKSAVVRAGRRPALTNAEDAAKLLAEIAA